MTLNNKKAKKLTNEKHMLLVNSPAWFALQRAKITAIESGNPRTICEIASGIIIDRLGASNG